MSTRPLQRGETGLVWYDIAMCESEGPIENSGLYESRPDPLRAKINGRIRTTAHRLIAEGDYVVVEARGSNTTKSGVPYNNNYCFVFRLSDNQLKEVTEYFDTELVTAALGHAEA